MEVTMEPSESAKGIAIISLSVKGEEKQKFIEISPSDEGTSTQQAWAVRHRAEGAGKQKHSTKKRASKIKTAHSSVWLRVYLEGRRSRADTAWGGENCASRKWENVMKDFIDFAKNFKLNFFTMRSMKKI